MDVQRLISDFEENLNNFSCCDDFIETKAELQNSFNMLKEAINYTRCSTQLNHEDFTIGEKVWMTTNKIVEIDTFCEDGTILVEDAHKCYKVHKQELRKVV